MKKNIRRLMAMVLVLAMVLGISAMAESKITSGSFRLPDVKVRETQPENTDPEAPADGAAGENAQPEIPEQEIPNEEVPSEEPSEEPAAETVIGTAYVVLEHAESRLNVRAAAGMDAEIIGSLNHGDKVSILANEGEWTKTTAGYVKSSYLSSSAPAEEPEVPAEDIPAADAPAEQEPTVEEPTVEEPAAEPVSTEGLRQIIVTLKEGETDLPLYAEVGGEIIASIPAGAILHVKSVDAGFSYAVYGGVAGYVDTDKIALFNSEASEEEKEIIRSVSVSANVGQTPSHAGDQIILSATLSGFEDVAYRLQWQCSPDGGATIIDIPGANDAQYSFIINDENAAYLWRVCVTILEVTEEAPAGETAA